MEDERSANSAAGEVYDVFLSFRGPDTRLEFVDFLYNIMIDAGIKVYRDDDELVVGQKIETILPAIDNSRICMPVFSENFASSSWCLREVKRMVDLQKEIIPIFYHVTSDDVKLNTSLYKDQLKNLKEKHPEDQILLWETARKQTVKSKGRELKDQGAYGFVNELVKDLLIKLKIKHESIPEYLIGIDSQLESAMKLLNIKSGDIDVRLMRIYGTGGMGKTTLAKYIFNKIRDKFDCYCFLDDIAGELSRQNNIENLLERLLVNLNPKLKYLVSSANASSIMQKNFQSQKVLIVLDNVDQKQQIQNLVGNGNWFGLGSRIIVTTRDDSVLVEDEGPESSSRSQSTKVCALEMEALNSKQSLQLFCWHAFQKDSPKPEYKDLANQAVSSVGGLPLSLEVISSLLRGKDQSFWKDKVAQLKQIVHPDVKEKLRISFDALEISVQQIFLDIACFFITFEVSNPKYMWEACNLYPTVGLNVLTSRSLMKIQNERFWMHDQFRILGREIARDGSFKGPECYRLYEQKEAMNMLRSKKGKENIVGLQLDKSCDTFTADCFADLFSLRYLSVKHASLTSSFHPLPNLKWLVLNSCPTNFDMCWLSSSDLVILNLSDSSIDEKWLEWIHIKSTYLKVIDLSYCKYLEVTPSFSNMVNLSSLNFGDCSFLLELTEDLHSLENLKYLNLENCSRLTGVSKSLGKLKSLVILNINHTPLRTLPDSVGELKKLEQLLLQFSTIVELPETFGGLDSLVFLDLSYSRIEKLPNSIGRLKRLEQLLLNSCFQIKRLPKSLGDLESLVMLNLSRSGVMALPSSVGKLKRLEMEESKMDRLPSEIGELHSLTTLNLSGASNIQALPSSLSELSLLKVLILVNTQLQELPELPQTLTKLHIISRVLVKVPNLSRLSNLTDLKLLDGSQWFVKTRISESHHLKGIGNLLRLKSVQLIISNITTLPQDLTVLSQLSSLMLGCPSFTCIPQLPTSMKILQLRSEHSKLEIFNLSYLSDLESLYICGFSLTSLCELQLPESLNFLSLANCQTQSTSDCIPPLKNLVHLELLRCKDLHEISGLESLESLETLDIECCESLQHIGHLFERVKVKILSCPVLNLESNKFFGTHMFKYFSREVAHDENIIGELIKRDDLERSEYLSWWEGSSNEEITYEQVSASNEEITYEQEKLNGDNSDIANDVVVHDLKLLLSSPDRDFLIRNNGQKVQIDSIIKYNTGYRIMLLFSASWCVSSQLVILIMKELYKDEYANLFIFVSLDGDDESFMTHFSQMPWLAIPFSDTDKYCSLVQLFKVTDIPHLVIVDEHGKVLRTGLSEIVPIPFLRESSPMLFKVQRDVVLRNQSLTSLLVDGLYNYVLTREGIQIPTSTLEGKIVALYFAYPLITPCVFHFHKRLTDVYEKLKRSEENFEILHVLPFKTDTFSWGEDVGNFLLLSMNHKRFSELVHHFVIKNLPALVLIGSNGETLNIDAVDAVTEHGVAAYPFTMEKLAEIGWEVVGQNEAIWRKHSLRSAMALHDSLKFVNSYDGSILPGSVLQGKVLGIYFAHPSQSCMEFTLELLDVYEKLNDKVEKFKVLYVHLRRHTSVFDKQTFSQSFLFCGDCRGLDSQSGLLIHLSHKSNEGEALKWNSSLPLDALRSFDDGIDRFTS